MSDTISAAVSENRITFATWTQLRLPEGAPIQAGENPVLSVSAHFLRTINPLQYSRAFAAVERDASAVSSGARPQPAHRSGKFESPEHEGMASHVTLQFGPGVVQKSNFAMPLTNSAQVSYQQTIALAGDFYGVPASPISDGATLADRKTRFLAAFNTFDTGNPSQISEILSVMQMQAMAVESLVPNLSGSDRYSQAFTRVNSGHHFDKLYNGATGGSSGSDWLLHQGSYLKLGAVNWDHFGSHAVAAYTAGHSAAIDQAVAAAAVSDPARQHLAMQRAYLMEAFCAHFLADLFSAGHLRTPRKGLHDDDGVPDLLTQDMHDEDSYNGLMVSSSANRGQWPAYGDKRMMDPDNATNLGIAQGALQASAQEIYAAFSSGHAADPSTYAALQMIPALYPLYDAQNSANWPPLFIRGGDQSAQLADANSDPIGCSLRFPAKDLSARAWIGMDTLRWGFLESIDLLSLSLWAFMPGGGYHSLEGAPPARIRQLDQLAHPFNWSTSYVFPDDAGARIAKTKAPCAVLTANTSTHEADIHVFYTFTNPPSGELFNIWHLTTPMSNVSSQSFGAGSRPHQSSMPYQTTGQPAAIAVGGIINLIYPAGDGTLWQGFVNLSDGTNSPTRAIYSSQPASFRMNAGGRVALAASSLHVYMAYRGLDDTLFLAAGNPRQTGITWGLPMAVSVGGNNVQAASDPTLAVIDGDLYLAVAGTASGGDPIVIYKLPPLGPWQQLVSGIHDSSGNAIKVRSFAQMFAYADGYAVIGTDPTAGSIQTYVPQRNYAPQNAWVKSDVKVWVQATQPPQDPTVKTNYPVSVVFYEGNPYIVYSDSTKNALSVISAVPVAMRPR